MRIFQCSWDFLTGILLVRISFFWQEVTAHESLMSFSLVSSENGIPMRFFHKPSFFVRISFFFTRNESSWESHEILTSKQSRVIFRSALSDDCVMEFPSADMRFLVRIRMWFQKFSQSHAKLISMHALRVSVRKPFWSDHFLPNSTCSLELRRCWTLCLHVLLSWREGTVPLSTALSLSNLRVVGVVWQLNNLIF